MIDSVDKFRSVRASTEVQSTGAARRCPRRGVRGRPRAGRGRGAGGAVAGCGRGHSGLALRCRLVADRLVIKLYKIIKVVLKCIKSSGSGIHLVKIGTFKLLPKFEKV